MLGSEAIVVAARGRTGSSALADLLCWAFADQEERTKAIEAFRDGKKDVLVATDVASKGLDFPAIQHVINYDMPEEIENYGRDWAPWGTSEGMVGWVQASKALRLSLQWLGAGVVCHLAFAQARSCLFLHSSPYRAYGPFGQHWHCHHLHQQGLR